jgi:hypothetical protein
VSFAGLLRLCEERSAVTTKDTKLHEEVPSWSFVTFVVNGIRYFLIRSR